MTTKLIDRGWQKIQTNLKALKNIELTVGVQGEEARVKDPDSDVTVVDYAIYNHFGTKHIPARPFLQNAIDGNSKSILKGINKGLAQVLAGKKEPKVLLNQVGAHLVGLVQKEIADGVPPPNSPKTIKRKGHTKTLIGGRLAYKKRDGTPVAAETGGRLRKSITYEIRY